MTASPSRSVERPEALARLESRSFDLVVSDLRMPDLDGPALLLALRQRHPELARRLVLITGDALGAEVNEAIREANLPVFEKPLDSWPCAGRSVA